MIRKYSRLAGRGPSTESYPVGMDEDAGISGFCPRFHHAIEIVGRRWSGAIVRALLAGATRFCHIRETVPGLSDRLLSERLKELEAEGIVERRVIPQAPARIEYHLTPKGADLAGVVEAVSTWSQRWLDEAEPDGDTSGSAGPRVGPRVGRRVVA